MKSTPVTSQSRQRFNFSTVSGTSRPSRTSRRFPQWLGGLCLALSLPVCAATSGPQESAWLNRLASSGNHDAQLQLGLAYQEGRYGLSADPKTGLYWLEQAAAGGLPYAEDAVANAYASGTGTAPDMATAMHWWQLAAAGGNVDAQVRLGEQLANTDPAAGRQWLEQAADQGNPRAEADLRSLYSKAAVPPTDIERGKDRLDSLSAQLKLPTLKAASLFWDVMTQGLSAEKSESALKQAAQTGDPIAEFQLAMHYRNGAWGVNRDPVKALFWLRHAAADGNPVAMKALAEVYRSGELGVAPDKARAARWEIRAAAATAQHI